MPFDPIIIKTIASSAVSLLAPYLAKTAKEFLGEIEKDLTESMKNAAWKKVSEIFNIIKAKFEKKNSAKGALCDFEKAPEDPDVQAAVRLQLRKMLEDEKFATQLAILLKEATEAKVDVVFNTNVEGDVEKLTQIGNVYGNVII